MSESTIQGARNGRHKITVIVPCYNVTSKIGRCVDSLDKLVFDKDELEIIFVDDCSSDGTADLVRRFCRTRPNWRIVELESNSGSPSKPRNIGVAEAAGEYVFFLDADDELMPDALGEQYSYAKRWDADVVRSSLMVAESGKDRRLTNEVRGFNDGDSKCTKITKILSQQSTTNSSLIKRQFLLDYSLRWHEHLHMGEDTVYLIDVLAKAEFIGYVDSPGIIYNKFGSESKSATQVYGARELESHLEVWTLAEDSLSGLGISYLEIRGQVAIRVAVEGLHKYYAGNIHREHLQRFALFLDKYQDALGSMTFPPRVSDTLQLVSVGDYEGFLEDIKPRLVIAGGDLKFIEGAIPVLREKFQIRIDRWTGHDSHDAIMSEELLKWGEIIWCEWLLGNAVWYAQRKRWNQKLIVRLHLFELTRDFGNNVSMENVDCFISVSVPTAEDMIDTFNFPRHKVRVIPNYVDVRTYKRSEDEARIFRLALVGILPARKGLLKALQLLKSLRDVDSRFTLTLIGKNPQDLPWVRNDPREGSYYSLCERYERVNQLEAFVKRTGWVDTKETLSDYGYVLSLSDFESFHVAPAESFAAGNQAVFLPWRGAEFIFPTKYIFEDIYAIRDHILGQRSIDAFDNYALAGQEYVSEVYSLDRFALLVEGLCTEI